MLGYYLSIARVLLGYCLGMLGYARVLISYFSITDYQVHPSVCPSVMIELQRAETHIFEAAIVIVSVCVCLSVCVKWARVWINSIKM